MKRKEMKRIKGTHCQVFFNKESLITISLFVDYCGRKVEFYITLQPQVTGIDTGFFPEIDLLVDPESIASVFYLEIAPARLIFAEHAWPVFNSVFESIYVDESDVSDPDNEIIYGEIEDVCDYDPNSDDYGFISTHIGVKIHTLDDRVFWDLIPKSHFQDHGIKISDLKPGRKIYMEKKISHIDLI